MEAFIPEVTVTPVTELDGTLSSTEFDITFTGKSGKKDHPTLVISEVQDDEENVDDGQGNSLTELSYVSTLKEPTGTFRVNPEEMDCPLTCGLDVYDQTHPSVAMDADGDFVITWESEVPDSAVFGSVSDIFACRFSPFGKVEDVQQLVFESNIGGLPLTGNFKLWLDFDGDDAVDPGETTTDISFNSGDVEATRGNIEDAVRALRTEYQHVTVSVVNRDDSDEYGFRVRFGGEMIGVDVPPIEYVADPTPLEATVSVLDESFVPGMVKDINGTSAGVRALAAPGAEDVQRITFTGNNPVTGGNFKLVIGEYLTDDIDFENVQQRTPQVGGARLWIQVHCRIHAVSHRGEIERFKRVELLGINSLFQLLRQGLDGAGGHGVGFQAGWRAWVGIGIGFGRIAASL